METGPRFKVSSERLEKPRIELGTPGLQTGSLTSRPRRLVPLRRDKPAGL